MEAAAAPAAHFHRNCEAVWLLFGFFAAAPKISPNISSRSGLLDFIAAGSHSWPSRADRL